MKTRYLLFAALALAAAGLVFFWSASERGPQIDLGPYDALGAAAAEEAVKLAAGKAQIVVMVRDTSPNSNVSVETELKAFQEIIRKSRPGADLAIERVPVSPMLMMSTGGGVPLDRLFATLAAHTNAAALVLFFALPGLDESQIETLKNSGVKIIVVSSLRPAYKQFLEQQAIHRAIVPRADRPPAGSPTPRTWRERFAQEFILLTPADVPRLP